MITVLLVTDYAEVIVRHYKTDSEDDALRQFGADWARGRVIIDSATDSGIFGSEWVQQSVNQALEDVPEYQDGVRCIHFYCTGGPDESDDRQAWAYFIHSTEQCGEPAPPPYSSPAAGSESGEA